MPKIVERAARFVALRFGGRQQITPAVKGAIGRRLATAWQSFAA